MSAMLCQAGCARGSHSRIWGSSSIGATTPTTGCVLESWMIWSGFIIPKVIWGSWYISAAAVWKPTAGPPARSSSRTPVLLPWTTSGPVTRLCAASMLAPGPRSWYTAPCSDCGYQLVCTTTGSGQTPLRFTNPLAAGEAWPLSLSVAPEQAAASSATASATTTSRPLRCGGRAGVVLGTATIGRVPFLIVGWLPERWPEHCGHGWWESWVRVSWRRRWPAARAPPRRSGRPAGRPALAARATARPCAPRTAPCGPAPTANRSTGARRPARRAAAGCYRAAGVRYGWRWPAAGPLAGLAPVWHPWSRLAGWAGAVAQGAPPLGRKGTDDPHAFGIGQPSAEGTGELAWSPAAHQPHQPPGVARWWPHARCGHQRPPALTSWVNSHSYALTIPRRSNRLAACARTRLGSSGSVLPIAPANRTGSLATSPETPWLTSSAPI